MRFLLHHPPPTPIHTLSLHDALPISAADCEMPSVRASPKADEPYTMPKLTAFMLARCSAVTASGAIEKTCEAVSDRKSTRLNSSHSQISYAVFCLKKKNTNTNKENAR